MAQDGGKIVIRPHRGFQAQMVRTNVDVCVAGGSLGGGKAQPLYARVCTPFGFRRMGDLKVGDTISGFNGRTEKVIQVFERGEMDIVEFTFSDGRKVQCAKDHLWKARRVSSVSKKYKRSGDADDLWRVMTTEEIISILDSRFRGKVFIPLCSPVQFTKGNRNCMTIHPYLLGCLLGDGCLSESLYSPMLTTADTEIVEKISSLGYNIHNVKSDERAYYIYDKDVVRALKKRNLWGKLSHEKFIPECYKASHIDERYELLQGLLDTDGTIDERGHIEYYTTSRQMADDVAWIVRSLGGHATIHVKSGWYRKNGVKVECKDCYRIAIRARESERLFHLSRKKERVKAEKYRRGGADEELAIVSYKILPPTEMRCITVSNPDNLYITDDFTVTHNSFGAVLATVEPSSDPRWRGLFLRNNIDDLKAGGGLIDTFREVYGDTIQIRSADMSRVIFPSGAYVDVTHAADQSRKTLLRRFKGRQYDFIYFDEATGFSWEAFTTILSRNRGTSSYAGKCILTTNPEREHWLRSFLDWYIGDDGYAIDSRSGVVRYFYMLGSDVKDVAWGGSKEEVYRLCRHDIDKKLDRVYGCGIGRDKWPSMIKSFAFYLGRMSENTEMLANNEGYLASIAMMGGAEADKMLGGNWNASAKDEGDDLVSYEEAASVFANDPQTNGDRWVTCDLADTGTDNVVALSWDGFHVTDIMVLNRSTPRENADRLRIFAAEHDVADSHIIYDAIRARYINDYIEEAVPFESYRAPMGMYALQYVKLKDECYARLVYHIKNNGISFDDAVARRAYTHQNLRESINVEAEFIEEARVIRWTDASSGKKRLMTKKEMNKLLGRGRSMDLLDPCAMRMYPVLQHAYGYELENGRRDVVDSEADDHDAGRVDIYDETVWG